MQYTIYSCFSALEQRDTTFFYSEEIQDKRPDDCG